MTNTEKLGARTVTKRDLISEIQAKKLRFPEHHQGSFRLFYLQHSFSEYEKAASQAGPVHSLFIIGIVACLEVAIRDAIRKLIDHGSPFIDRISQFKDLLRLDVNVGRALHDRKVSFGDLVSHLLPVSNIEQIKSHFSILFDKDFRRVLADAREFIEPSIPELISGRFREAGGCGDSFRISARGNDHRQWQANVGVSNFQ